ncbi:MAG: HD domain-containing phosphohydrolase [Actinomycetota bacterium]
MTNSSPPGAQQPGETFEPAAAAPARYCLLATFAGLVLPAAAAIAVLGWARSGTIRTTGWSADLVVAFLAVAAAVAVALLAQAAWRRWSLPQPGLGEFLPHRWLQRREALMRSRDFLADLRAMPPGPSPRAADLLVELASALAATDPYRRGRPGRRAKLCAELARELDLPEEQARQLQLAAQLQDIGLATVPPEILDQAGPLEEGQDDLVRRHSSIGAGLIAPWVDPAVTAAVQSHHEHLDGGGYPWGLGGPEIPPLAVLLAVVDSYDALVSDRPQRRRFTQEEAARELHDMAGTWLAETPVAAMLAVAGHESPRTGSVAVNRLRHAVRGSAAPLTAGLAVLLVGLAAWGGELAPVPTTIAAATQPQASPATEPSPAASPQAPPPTPGTSGASPTPSPPAAPATGQETTPSPGAPTTAASGGNAKTTKTTSTNSSTNSASTGSQTGSQQSQTTTSPSNHQAVNPPMVIQVPPDDQASPNPAPNPSPTQAPPPNSGQTPPPPSPSPKIVQPTVDTNSPLAGPAAGGTPVTIYGSGFTGATGVVFGTNSASFQIVSDTEISAVSPAGKGIVAIKVVTPAGTSTSLLALFTYTGGGIL